jgi:hypothetical protein
MSALKLRKFVPRAPRYVLRPQDKHIMRFALEKTHGEGGIEHTVLYNLSETGVAFLVDPGTEFKVGDLIKVEVPVPQADQIAWWARVVRMEEYEPRTWFFSNDPFKDQTKILVACRFEDLPEPHSRTLRQGIERSFIQAMRDQQFRNLFYYRTWAIQNLSKLLLYALLTAASLGFLYYISRPSANYDPQRGAPWGERFKF